jgi:iron complex transport system substrate-binding protein
VTGPLWPRLGAVAEGCAYAAEDDVCFIGIGLGLATANLTVEDLADRPG